MAGFSLIKIFSDTNILHASQSHLLLSAKVAEYISEHKRIESVELKWIFPKMVVDERRHQMLQAARGLKPKIGELEKLLGHNLGINDEILAERIDTKIAKTKEDLDIEIVDLEHSNVDWPALIDRSAKREPPFEVSGEKEKGFRDSIIANTFIQEVKRSPTTPRSCLLVFISGDKLIREYIQEQCADAKNVRLLESLDDLKSLLNAIASEITEEFLQEYTPKAKKLFYDFEKEDGLYKKSDVYNLINRKLSSELSNVVESWPGSTRLENGVRLGDQTFIRKEGQTVVWRTEVQRKFKVLAPRAPDNSASLLTIHKGLLGTAPNREVLASGASLCLVEWQHQVTTTGKVSRSKVIDVEFDGHEWDEQPEI